MSRSDVGLYLCFMGGVALIWLGAGIALTLMVH